MKQLIYGPSGYGKSHMILHSLPEKKVVYITTNSKFCLGQYCMLCEQTISNYLQNIWQMFANIF